MISESAFTLDGRRYNMQNMTVTISAANAVQTFKTNVLLILLSESLLMKAGSRMFAAYYRRPE